MFQKFIHKAIEKNKIIVQPRMGYSNHSIMREGLLEVKNTNFLTIGTITIDSFTRTLQFEDALRAIKKGKPLNGYPIVSYSCEENKKLIDGIKSNDFPIQVRHGCPKPEKIFEATINAGIDAIEGGPISYSLPYGRISLKESIQSWANCSKMYAEAGNGNYHIESFGGCMLGQLCPPSMLIVISILEVLFFNSYGVNSVSVSLAQGTNSQQDIAALKALKKLCNKYLAKNIDWHIVFYTFMGKFPETIHGAKAILSESSIIANMGEARRLIVKTINEAHQIPTINDNISALKLANEVANNSSIASERITENEELENQIYDEANQILETILNLSSNLDIVIQKAFEKGYIDIPFCLHQDNIKKSKSTLDSFGNIVWAEMGNIPQQKNVNPILKNSIELTSKSFLKMLSYNQIKFDNTM